MQGKRKQKNTLCDTVDMAKAEMYIIYRETIRRERNSSDLLAQCYVKRAFFFSTEPYDCTDPYILYGSA